MQWSDKDFDMFKGYRRAARSWDEIWWADMDAEFIAKD
jgi:hypothetical protein